MVVGAQSSLEGPSNNLWCFVIQKSLNLWWLESKSYGVHMKKKTILKFDELKQQMSINQSSEVF